MSEYHGDIDLGDTVQWTFTTVDSTGLPTVLTGTPTATAYTDGGITQSATGVTLTADFDGVVGLNLISIVASSGNGFAAGENIEIVLDAGTVGGVSVVGYAIGGFSIANRSPLRPTTIGRTLDVSATGEAGLDWANIGAPTTSQTLSGTTVGTTTTNTDMRGTDSALLAASAPTNFGDLSITVTTGLVDITQTAADKVWATAARLLTAGTNIVLAKGVGVTGFNDIPATDVVSAGAITTLAGAVVNVDTVDGLTASNLDATVSSRATPAQVNTEVLDVMNVDTITLPGQTAPPLAPTHRQAIAWLYKVFRNRKTQTATQWSLMDDTEAVVDAKATVSDDATTAIKQEIVSGP